MSQNRNKNELNKSDKSSNAETKEIKKAPVANKAPEAKKAEVEKAEAKKVEAKKAETKNVELKKPVSPSKPEIAKVPEPKKPAAAAAKKPVVAKKPSGNVNYTVSKKGPKEWTVKQDGVEGYAHHTSKALAFAYAESKVREIKGREGRIKIHEDGKYTSNWFIESNKQAKLSSGNQDAEILALLKVQKEKIMELNKVKTASKKEDALTIAKEAKADAAKANNSIAKMETEHEVLRKADAKTDADLQELKVELARVSEENAKFKKSSKLEKALLIIMFILIVAMFVYIALVAADVINAPWI